MMLNLSYVWTLLTCIKKKVVRLGFHQRWSTHSQTFHIWIFLDTLCDQCQIWHDVYTYRALPCDQCQIWHDVYTYQALPCDQCQIWHDVYTYQALPCDQCQIWHDVFTYQALLFDTNHCHKLLLYFKISAVSDS